jgi:hypothetical protein
MLHIISNGPVEVAPENEYMCVCYLTAQTNPRTLSAFGGGSLVGVPPLDTEIRSENESLSILVGEVAFVSIVHTMTNGRQ